MIVWLGPATTALGWPSWLAPQTPQVPHPSVVRVIARERDGLSLGSGSLVAADANHGLVVTNWHVIRDAAGPISVAFPDGFRSGALVLRTDREWDLAALAIQRPSVQPILLSSEPPRQGDVLTIAGYGSGSYRAVSGRCTEYLSPGGNLPNEIVELDVAARQGDSGGPILNTRGELAGVLFGANDTIVTGGYTMGSYCGRVRQFVASVSADFQRLPGNSAVVAQSSPAAQPPPATTVAVPAAAWNAAKQDGDCQRPIVADVPAARPQPSQPPQPTAAPAVVSPPQPAATPKTAGEPPPTRGEQIKTILAAIGVISILFHAIRLVGAG